MWRPPEAMARPVDAITAEATMSTGIISRMVWVPAGTRARSLRQAKAKGAEVVNPSFQPGKG